MIIPRNKRFYQRLSFKRGSLKRKSSVSNNFNIISDQFFWRGSIRNHLTPLAFSLENKIPIGVRGVERNHFFSFIRNSLLYLFFGKTFRECKGIPYSSRFRQGDGYSP